LRLLISTQFLFETLDLVESAFIRKENDSDEQIVKCVWIGLVLQCAERIGNDSVVGLKSVGERECLKELMDEVEKKWFVDEEYRMEVWKESLGVLLELIESGERLEEWLRMKWKGEVDWERWCGGGEKKEMDVIDVMKKGVEVWSDEMKSMLKTMVFENDEKEESENEQGEKEKEMNENGDGLEQENGDLELEGGNEGRRDNESDCDESEKESKLKRSGSESGGITIEGCVVEMEEKESEEIVEVRKESVNESQGERTCEARIRNGKRSRENTEKESKRRRNGGESVGEVGGDCVVENEEKEKEANGSGELVGMRENFGGCARQVENETSERKLKTRNWRRKSGNGGIDWKMTSGIERDGVLRDNAESEVKRKGENEKDGVCEVDIGKDTARSNAKTRARKGKSQNVEEEPKITLKSRKGKRKTDDAAEAEPKTRESGDGVGGQQVAVKETESRTSGVGSRSRNKESGEEMVEDKRMRMSLRNRNEAELSKSEHVSIELIQKCSEYGVLPHELVGKYVETEFRLMNGSRRKYVGVVQKLSPNETYNVYYKKTDTVYSLNVFCDKFIVLESTPVDYQ